KTPCNPARRIVIQILAENPPDDLSFLCDDFKVATLTGHCAIAICSASRTPPLADHTEHTAPDLLGVVHPIHVADHGLEPDHDFIDRTSTIIHGQYVDARELEPFMQPRQVLHVTRQSVQRFNDHHV